MIAPLPHNESERLAALYQHHLLDTAPEEEFDNLVRLAAQICGVPFAAISFIDAHRQWFKSILGYTATEIPRDMALCAHTLLQRSLLSVPDTQTDPRFQDNPQVTGAPNIRFYAGAALITEDGHAIGTLCVADRAPKYLKPDQEEGLRLLARLAASQLKAARRVTERECLMAEKERLLAEREKAETALTRTHTALMESNACLQESEQRLLRLTAAAYEGIAVSQDGVVVDASPAFATLFGYDHPYQMIGLIPKEFATPAFHAIVAHKIDVCDEQPYEAELRRRDGTTFQAELRGRMILLGTRPARITVVRDITERKQAEEALRHSQARLAEAQQVARIGSWEYDIGMARNTWSEELFHLFGIPPSEGEPSLEALIAQCHPEDISKLRALSAQAIQDCFTYELDLRILPRDGSIRWAHVVGRGECNETGKVTRLFGTLMDITGRRLAEERFRVLFERSSDAHLLFDEKGIIDCNHAAVALLRCSDKAQVLSLHPAVLSPDFQPDGRRSLEKSTEMDALARERGYHRFEWIHQKMDGEEFPVEVTLTPVTLDNRPVLLVVWHDLTERKHAEEALQASHERLIENEARLRLAMESARLGSYEIDPATGEYLEVSDIYKAQLGLTPDAELSLSKTIRIIHPDDYEHIQKIINQAIAERKIFTVEHRVVWPDGSIHWVIGHGQPIYDEAGQLVRIIGVNQDITERKRAEQQIRDHSVKLEFQKQELEKLNVKLATLATTDGLTGLTNHRAFQERLAEEVSRATRYGTPLSLVLLDVDHFKQYNDTHGHPGGDAVLRIVARILRDGARDTDVVARYGGEEFVLILPETNGNGAAALAERLRSSVESQPWPMQAITASFGIASLRQGEVGGAEMIARADGALYQSKVAGRNRVTYSSDTFFLPK